MIWRGGDQVIPRPPGAKPGGPAPWATLQPDQRRGLSLERVLEALGRHATPPAVVPDVFLETEPDAPEPSALEPGGEPGAGVDELGANGAGAVADPEAAVEAQVGLPPGSDVGARIPSAVLVCLFEEAGEARVILTRRSRDLRFHKGEVSFPGGRCERGETPAQGALREASEEISLDSDAVTIAGQLSPLLTLSSQSLIVPVVGTLVERPVLEASPAEVEFVFDVALADLVADDVWREERWRFGPGRGGRPIPEDIPRQIVHPPVTDDGSFPVWFFELPGDTVWGATARVLVELLRTVLSV